MTHQFSYFTYLKRWIDVWKRIQRESVQCMILGVTKPRSLRLITHDEVLLSTSRSIDIRVSGTRKDLISISCCTYVRMLLKVLRLHLEDTSYLPV